MRTVVVHRRFGALRLIGGVRGRIGRCGGVLRVVLLALRLAGADRVVLGRARRKDWLGTLAQTLTGGGDKDGAGAGDDRDDGDGDREDDDLLLRLAALCRGLGAQAVRGDAGRGRAPRNLAHLLRSRGAAQVLLGIKLNGLVGAGGVVDVGVRALEGFGAGRDKVAVDLRGHNGDDRAHSGTDHRSGDTDLGGKRDARGGSCGAGDDLGNGNVVKQALFGRDGHGLSDGMVLVHAVVERCRRHDARARRVGVLGCHTGSSRCKSASFHAAIRVLT